jgi:membrane peptidoglycan carboxypeptidase
VPRYSYNLGVEYATEIRGYESFARMGYQYNSSYQNGTGPGTSSYTPDAWWVGATNYVNARVGFGRDGWELSIFAENLLNSSDVLSTTNGRQGCASGSGAACATYDQYTSPVLYTTFRPRTWGRPSPCVGEGLRSSAMRNCGAPRAARPWPAAS